MVYKSPIWHPCSQMKDYESVAPIAIWRAEGSYLILKDGSKVIDAIASWWCKSLGHQHPRLKKALLQQTEKFEHVILANTTHEIIEQLSEALTQLLPALNKVFYASEGSSAIEIALKMSVHARQITGEHTRKHFIALQNGYHGETVGALSVSDVGLYRAPYQSLLFNTHFVEEIPYVTGVHDPLWLNCDEHWQRIEKQLAPYADTATALLVEPIVQGAGGMKIYSQAFLKHLHQWARDHHIHFIADEIMTGIGRTGKMLAVEYANIEPDMLCLSKGLTSGWLPFSAVLVHEDIYQLFYDDYATGKAFLHSHTYCGNALAASVALEVLRIFKEENICEEACVLGKYMLQKMQSIANETGILKNVRGMGAIVAAEVLNPDERRLGFEIFKQALSQGALLRPLGNTLYWLPPLNTSFSTIDALAEITQSCIVRSTHAIYKYNSLIQNRINDHFQRLKPA